MDNTLPDPTPDQTPRPRRTPEPLTLRTAVLVIGTVLLLALLAPLAYRVLMDMVPQPPVQRGALPDGPTPERRASAELSARPTRSPADLAYERAYNDWDVAVQGGYAYWQAALPQLRRTLRSNADYRTALDQWQQGCAAVADVRATPLFAAADVYVRDVCSALDSGVGLVNTSLQPGGVMAGITEGAQEIERAMRYYGEASREYSRTHGIAP